MNKYCQVECCTILPCQCKGSPRVLVDLWTSDGLSTAMWDQFDFAAQCTYNNNNAMVFPGQPGQTGRPTRRINHSGIYWSLRWRGGRGISWTICKSFALHSRQITTSTPHLSVFTGRMLFLQPNQQCQSTEGQTAHIQTRYYDTCHRFYM